MYEKTENKRLSKNEIAMVKARLISGDLTTIQKILGKSRSHVYRVFKGDYYDSQVFKEALKIIKERSIKAALRQKKLRKALSAAREIESLSSSLL